MSATPSNSYNADKNDFITSVSSNSNKITARTRNAFNEKNQNDNLSNPIFISAAATLMITTVLRNAMEDFLFSF